MFSGGIIFYTIIILAACLLFIPVYLLIRNKTISFLRSVSEFIIYNILGFIIWTVIFTILDFIIPVNPQNKKNWYYYFWFPPKIIINIFSNTLLWVVIVLALYLLGYYLFIKLKGNNLIFLIFTLTSSFLLYFDLSAFLMKMMYNTP